MVIKELLLLKTSKKGRNETKTLLDIMGETYRTIRYCSVYGYYCILYRKKLSKYQARWECFYPVEQGKQIKDT